MDSINRSVKRMVTTLFIVAGVLGLIAVVIIVQGTLQVVTGTAKSFSFLVLALVPLAGAGVSGGVAFWLPRMLPSSLGKLPSGADPFQTAHELKTGQVDLETLQQTIQDRVGHLKPDSQTPGTFEGADGSQVSVQQWKNGVRVTRRVVKRTNTASSSEQNSTPQTDDANRTHLASQYPTNVFAPNELSQRLALANRLDLGALTTNRDGHLSLNQISTILGGIAVEVLFYVGLVAMLGAAALGFVSLNSQAWLGAIVPCGAAILLMVMTGLAFNYSKRIGADRYDRAPWTIGLVILDVLLGRVQSAGGMTSRRMEVYESRSRRYESRRTTDTGMTRYSYSYDVDGNSVNVSEAGYNAFPEATLNCQLYYLPLSKMLVNLQVMN